MKMMSVCIYKDYILFNHHSSFNDKKFMVPIHNDFIEKIDRENQCIFLVIPDGLLEII